MAEGLRMIPFWEVNVMSEKKKYLYLFSEGNRDMKEILGGKGANLAKALPFLPKPVPNITMMAAKSMTKSCRIFTSI